MAEICPEYYTSFLFLLAVQGAELLGLPPSPLSLGLTPPLLPLGVRSTPLSSWGQLLVRPVGSAPGADAGDKEEVAKDPVVGGIGTDPGVGGIGTDPDLALGAMHFAAQEMAVDSVGEEEGTRDRGAGDRGEGGVTAGGEEGAEDAAQRAQILQDLQQRLMGTLAALATRA